MTTLYRSDNCTLTGFGQGASCWHIFDQDLQAFLSLTPSLERVTGLRSGPGDARVLVFTASSLSLELEVMSDRVIGQILPPGPAKIHVEGSDGGTFQVEADCVPGPREGLGQTGLPAQMVVKGDHERDGGGVVDGDDTGHHPRGAQEIRALTSPNSSSAPAATPIPELQLPRTTRYGARFSRSRSYTVSGPSSSSIAENSGLSERNVPCAATCTSHAPSMAAITRSATALPSASTTASGYRAASWRISASPVASRGPPIRTTLRSSGGPARRARSHADADGATAVGRSRREGIRPQGTRAAFR